MDKNETTIPSHLSFITIEGVIGVGKTSLCELLAEAWNGRLILEQVEDNPFLARFYEDRKQYAFQTQLWFLLSRYRQLSEAVAQQDLFHRMAVSDYMFAKDRIFANINLDDDELQLYNRVAGILEAQVPRPDVVVYLQASTSVLLRRISKRGRPYEFNMDPSYIGLLNEAYNHFFFHYEQSPLLVINTDEVDFVKSESDLGEIIDQILKVRSGITYYQPLRSKDKAALKDRRPPAP
jgi:deoxyadenosine/deoxycytidine kinase